MEQLGDVGAKLLVEDADHDPDGRIELGRCECRVEIPEVVVTGQDDGRRALDIRLSQDARQPLVADHEPNARRGQRVVRVRVVADADDLLVAQPKLLDRSQPEVVEPADDHVTAGWHRRSVVGRRVGSAGGSANDRPGPRRRLSGRRPSNRAARG
jgi:hypothetical protein